MGTDQSGYIGLLTDKSREIIINPVFMKILIIEDEPEMQDLIRQSLENEYFLVETASDFNSGLDKIVSYDYDCILLDIMLPGGSGLDLLQELNRQGQTIVMVTHEQDIATRASRQIFMQDGRIENAHVIN